MHASFKDEFSKQDCAGSNILLVIFLLNQCTDIAVLINLSESASYKTVDISVHEKNELFIHNLKYRHVKNTQEDT